MGGHYEKGVYNQLMEVMEKLNAMESEHSRDRKEVKELTSEVTGLHKENASLREEVSTLKQKTTSLEKENAHLKIENRLLRDDNERMKRILDNDSSNSSTPPSKDQLGKAPNTFNGRKPAKQSCCAVRTGIEQELLNSDVIYTDATPVKTDGKQAHIRNFSTETCVLYCSSEKKELETFGNFKILKEFTGALSHDHERMRITRGAG